MEGIENRYAKKTCRVPPAVEISADLLRLVGVGAGDEGDAALGDFL